MKSSNYNLFVKFPDNKILLAFNAFTLALVEFPLKDMPIIQHILNEPDGQINKRGNRAKIRKTLEKSGFLIDNAKDELAILKVRNRMERFAQDNHLSLTIAPTLNCNFRCVYCYEKHKKEMMNAATMKALVKYVNKEMSDGKNLFVTWFGGEPLLAMGEIAYLSKKFMTITEKKNGRYNASMVTNGYLLKKKTAQKLKTYGVTRVQITIDGPKKIHDGRRPLINGQGTFETILNNIKDSCELLNISLRINVDKKNAPYTQEVLSTLEQEGLRNKISPYLGHVYPYTDICADVQKTCFRKEQFSFLEARFNLEMLEKGFTASSYPQDKGGFCTADSLHSIVVAPSGAIVKCWNNICDEEALIGHLLSREFSPKMHSNLCTWLAWDPFEKQTCIECEILPICMGGCPYIAFRKGLKDKGDCLDWKYNLKEMLSLYYLQKKKREEIEIANALITQVEKLRKEIKKEQKDQATA